MRNYKRHGFTLIELLTVIAIIGVLAAILIPVIGSVQRNAKIAASKSQISGYVNAIGLFKGEYNYYPFPKAHEDGGATINDDDGIGVADFIGALSATNVDGTRIESTAPEKFGNRKLISFYDFSDNDFLGGDSTGEDPKIADRFDNINIYIVIDGDGDGLVEGVPDPDSGETKDIRTKVTAYVLNDETTAETPNYYLYE